MPYFYFNILKNCFIKKLCRVLQSYLVIKVRQKYMKALILNLNLKALVIKLKNIVKNLGAFLINL